LQNKITDILVEPVNTDDVLMRHGVREVMIQTGQLNIQGVQRAQETILLVSVTSSIDLEALMKLAILQNEIAQGEIAINIEVPVELNDSEKTQFSNEWSTCRERNANLIKH
jgi:acetylglutamate synthase